jgi:anti-sigma factor RsiW
VRSRAPALLCCLLVTVALAGCGGDDTDEKRFQAEQIEQAKREAAREARKEERQRQELRELRREVARVKRASRSKSGSSGSSSSSSGNVPRAGSSSCGGGVSVGPNTTCAFALNVRDEYFASDGADVITVFSPVTERAYTMYCADSSPHVCTGGNNASVYFP